MLQANANGGAVVHGLPSNEATATSVRPLEGLCGSIGLGRDLRHLGGGWFLPERERELIPVWVTSQHCGAGGCTDRRRAGFTAPREGC